MCSAKSVCHMVFSLMIDIAEGAAFFGSHMGNNWGLSCLYLLADF